MYTFSVSQIYNSNICLIQLHLDIDNILIFEKIKFKTISTFYVIFNLIFNQFKYVIN